MSGEKPWQMLPPRSAQTMERLTPAGEQAALERRRWDPGMAFPPPSAHFPPPPGAIPIGEELPMLTYVARSTLGARAVEMRSGEKLSDDQRLFGDPSSHEPVLFMASQALLSDAKTAARLAWAARAKAGVPPPTTPSSKARYVDAGGLFAAQKKAQLAAAAAHGVETARDEAPQTLEEFFAADIWEGDDVIPPRALTDVLQWPMFIELQSAFQKKRAGERGAMENGTETLPRPPALQLRTPGSLVVWHLPPRLEDTRCVHGDACRFRVDMQGAGRGYVGRAFYLEGDDRAAPRPCVLCDRYDVHLQTQRAQQLRYVPDRAMNRYVVAVGAPNGYPPAWMHEAELNGRPTGAGGGSCSYL